VQLDNARVNAPARGGRQTGLTDEDVRESDPSSEERYGVGEKVNGRPPITPRSARAVQVRSTTPTDIVVAWPPLSPPLPCLRSLVVGPALSTWFENPKPAGGCVYKDMLEPGGCPAIWCRSCAKGEIWGILQKAPRSPLTAGREGQSLLNVATNNGTSPMRLLRRPQAPK